MPQPNFAPVMRSTSRREPSPGRSDPEILCVVQCSFCRVFALMVATARRERPVGQNPASASYFDMRRFFRKLDGAQKDLTANYIADLKANGRR
jgi:hypothetical protein